MHPTKAYGIDGILVLFFQKFQDFVRHDVIHVCLNVLNGGDLVALINKTVISLIPKIKQSKTR